MMLFWPYTFAPVEEAGWLWLGSNLLFTAGALALAFRCFGDRINWFERAVVCALFVAGTAWRTLIGNGQVLMMGLFFLMVGWALVRRGYWLAAGVAIAPSLLKYTSVAPLLLLFVFARD